MATYKDDLDILKAAEKDSNKLSLNAITELDNKGLLGMYGGGGESALELVDCTFNRTASDGSMMYITIDSDSTLTPVLIEDIGSMGSGGFRISVVKKSWVYAIDSTFDEDLCRGDILIDEGSKDRAFVNGPCDIYLRAGASSS